MKFALDTCASIELILLLLRSKLISDVNDDMNLGSKSCMDRPFDESDKILNPENRFAHALLNKASRTTQKTGRVRCHR